MYSPKFTDFDLNPLILQALGDLEFESPTPIQAEAIPALLESDKDFIGQAQTGTGKTGAFSLPLLEMIDSESPEVQALILAPTRELACQVEESIRQFSKYMDIRSICIFGGSPYKKQIDGLKRDRPQIVVGTPGRVKDLIERRVLKLGAANFCVLDEADEMLNMGFLDDVTEIMDNLSENRKLIMFSATMPKSIRQLVDENFREYDLIKVKPQKEDRSKIEQKYFVVQERSFTPALIRLIESSEDLYGMVFCRTRMQTTSVGEELRKRGHKAEVLNGDMGQAQRDRAMKNFREKRSNILVCTDVGARGIDVNNLTHVFNYGVPQDNDLYIHRIGRTARAGTTGKAFTIVDPKSAFIMKKIARYTNGVIAAAKLPTIQDAKMAVMGNEINNVRKLRDALKEKGESFQVDELFNSFKAEFADLDSESLMKLFFAWKFNSKFNLLDHSPKIIQGEEQRERPGRNERRRNFRRSDDKSKRSNFRRDRKKFSRSRR